MALLPQQIDYTDRDFDSLTLRLEGLLRSVFPDWTDFQVSTFGNILRDMFAFVGDNLAFYQDKQARESRIVTAVSRKNLIALSKLIAFEASTATAATVDETFTLAEVPANDVIIPAGSVVRTADVGGASEFQLLTDLTILAAANPPTVVQSVENSDSKQEVFVSDGLQNQEFILDEVPYLDNSSIIIAGDGAYTEVQTFLNSISTDKHYTAAVDQNDRATIRFGNGTNGSIPQGNISVLYKTGGGVDGNVEVNTITTIDGNFTDIFGNPVIVSVTNALRAAGGTDRQTIAQIKEIAPASLRVLNRTVAREDYEINSLKLTQVSRALMTTSNEDASVGENAGILYIIPKGGGFPSQALKDAVLIQVTETFPNTLTFTLVVSDPVYLTVDVEATVFLAQGFTEADIRTAVDDALESYFAIQNDDGSSNTNVDFGFNFKDNEGNPAGEIAKSDISNVVRDVQGVRKMGDNLEDFKLNGGTTDLAILLREFPQLGDVLLRNGDTGLLF